MLLEETESAVNATTVTVKGTNLSKLTLADLSVSNNTIKSFDVSADRTTATIKLGSELVEGEKVTFTAKEDKFDFTYKLDFASVGVVEATYDDNTKGQTLDLLVDGQKVKASDLLAAGYNVKFTVYSDKKATTLVASNTFFNSDSKGELLEDLSGLTIPSDGKDFYVAVTATKGSQVINSELGKVTIKNTDLASEAIDSYVLANASTGFNQTSKTFVVGETASIPTIDVKDGVDVDTIPLSSGDYSIKSSNPSVLAVDSSKNLKALNPGTATITITYGKVVKTETFTVTNVKRQLSKVSVVNGKGVEVSSLPIAKDGTNSSSLTGLYVKPVDQYGDINAIVGAAAPNTNYVTAAVKDADILASAAVGAQDAVNTSKTYGLAPLTLTLPGTLKSGTTYLTFDNNGFKVASNTFRVSVSTNATIANYKLELDSSSEASAPKLNVADPDSDTISYVLNGYSSEGAKVKAPETIAITDVEVTQGSAVVSAAVSSDVLTVTGLKAGTATITVTKNGKKYSQTITVINEKPSVTAGTFKAIEVKFHKVLTYKDLLTVTNDGNATVNPIVKNLTLNVANTQPVRIDPATGEIYIDKNANGSNDSETVVGYLKMQFVSANGTIGSVLTDVGTGFDTSASGNNEGTLTYSLYAADGTSIIASQAVKIDL